MDKVLENIRLIRESKGYTQDVISEKLKLSQPKYARFERGATKTDLDMLRKVATFFDMSLVDLITYPQKLVVPELVENKNNGQREIKATLSIEMGKEKKDQVFRFIFGDNDVEIFNK